MRQFLLLMMLMLLKESKYLTFWVYILSACNRGGVRYKQFEWRPQFLGLKREPQYYFSGLTWKLSLLWFPRQKAFVISFGILAYCRKLLQQTQVYDTY